MAVLNTVKILKHRNVVRANIALDAELVYRVKKLANVRTARKAIHIALDHYVRSRNYETILALKGTGGVAEGYDPKSSS